MTLHPTSLSSAQKFAGIHSILKTSVDNLHIDDIEDDMEGEQETLPELTTEDKLDDIRVPGTISRWREAITGASKGVTDRTEGEYVR